MPSQSIVFYDGGCGLCHRAVRFALAHDRDGSRFRFAALDGDAFRAAIPAPVRPTLPDSLVLLDPDGTLHVRSDAVLSMCRRLGGRWRVLAAIAGVLPRRVLDAAYDGVARVRLRLFARPTTACPMVPPHLRDRFL
jgi:predicted DCC family thiol-disulfide oxidoreductase YuxK